MERREPTQKALVLAGGGARGSYQVGVWRALMELDWHPQIITGTSVGGLNGAMFVLDLYETARDMWLTIRSRDVMELPEENADLSALHQFLRRVVKEGGMDVTPLEEIVERVLDEDALRAAPIRFGLVTVEQRGLRPRELTLEDIPAGQVRDYLMASAACFPALRARQIDGVKFLDGGYSDNMPTGLAKTMGAEELVCVDLEGVGITRPNLTGLPTTMIRSYWELGDILHFDPDTAKRNMELGYYDTRRAMGYLRGCAYAVSCDAQSCEDAAAFAQKFSQLQKAVREKYPVTLTADVALKLANMKKGRPACPAGSRRRGRRGRPHPFLHHPDAGRGVSGRVRQRAYGKLCPAVHGQQHRRAGGAGRFAAQYILTGAGVAHFDRTGFAGGDRR